METEAIGRELDDSGCVQDGDLPFKTQQYRPVELMDLSDDVLLCILKFCAPMELKALAYTCPRLARLALEWPLWTRVDLRAVPYDRHRLYWLMRYALSYRTTGLLLRGHAQEATGCSEYATRLQEKLEADKIPAHEASDTPEGFMQVDWAGDEVRRNPEHAGPAYIIREMNPQQINQNVGPLNFNSAQNTPKKSNDQEDSSACPSPTVTLTRTALKFIMNHCNLNTLALEYCNINLLTTSLEVFPRRLKHLSLRGTRCYNMPRPHKTFLFKLHDYLPYLEYLDISECAWLEPSAFLPLSKLMCLKELYLMKCPRLSEFVAYASLATRYGFKVLEVIDFRGSPVGDSEISSFSAASALRVLRCSAPQPPEALPHQHCEKSWLWETEEPEYLKKLRLDVDIDESSDDSEQINKAKPNCGSPEPEPCGLSIVVSLNNVHREQVLQEARLRVEQRINDLVERRLDDNFAGGSNVEYINVDAANGNVEFGNDNGNSENGSSENENGYSENGNGTDRSEGDALKLSQDGEDLGPPPSKKRKRDDDSDSDENKPSTSGGAKRNKVSVTTDDMSEMASTSKSSESDNTNKESSDKSEDSSDISGNSDRNRPRQRPVDFKVDVDRQSCIVMVQEHNNGPVIVRRYDPAENDNGVIVVGPIRVVSNEESNENNAGPSDSGNEPNAETGEKQSNSENNSESSENRSAASDNLRRITARFREVGGSSRSSGNSRDGGESSRGNGERSVCMCPLGNANGENGQDGQNPNENGEGSQQNCARRMLRDHNNVPVILRPHGIPPEERFDDNNDPRQPDRNQDVRQRISNRINLHLNSIFNANINRYIRHPVIYVDYGDPNNRHRNVEPENPPDTSLVTDSAILRFGTSIIENRNIILLSLQNRPMADTRPERSNLEELVVNGYTMVTDRSLVHLATAAPQLRLLDLRRTRVTARGVENFKNLRPDCKVLFSDFDENPDGDME